jgi:hypothetical protein
LFLSATAFVENLARSVHNKNEPLSIQVENHLPTADSKTRWRGKFERHHAKTSLGTRALIAHWASSSGANRHEPARAVRCRLVLGTGGPLLLRLGEWNARSSYVIPFDLEAGVRLDGRKGDKASHVRKKKKEYRSANLKFLGPEQNMHQRPSSMSLTRWDDVGPFPLAD